MTKHLWVVILVMIAAPAPFADAQIIQSVNRFSTAGDSEKATAIAAENGEKAQGAQIISQANVDVSADSTKIGIQAVDLWMTPYIRMYGRLTLPVKSTDSPSTPASTAASSSAASSGSNAARQVSATAKQQLVDPYGGLFNLSGGAFYSLANPFASRKAKGDVKGYQTKASARQMFSLLQSIEESNGNKGTGAEEAASELQDPHGIFLDVRAGLKFIDLPAPGDSSPTVGESKVAVFYSGIAGLKVIAPLYDARPTGDGAVDSGHETGGLTLGGYFVYNFAADTSQSTAFVDQLNRRTAAVTGVIGWNLPNTSIAALNFSFTPWTSDSRLGKTFVFGVALQSQTGKDTK